jgi:ABC-2 type transport system permease protein
MPETHTRGANSIRVRTLDGVATGNDGAWCPSAIDYGVANQPAQADCAAQIAGKSARELRLPGLWIWPIEPMKIRDLHGMRTAGLDRYIGTLLEKPNVNGELPAVVRFGAGSSKKDATVRDVLDGLRRWRIWISLGWLDVKQRYRRAVLGPFWITISMSVLVLTLGTIYAGIFNQDVHSFLPYLAGGFIVWNFCTATINESATAFVLAEGMIKQGGMPLSLHVFRTIFRNFMINGHNLSVMLFLYVWQPSLLNWNLLLLIPGLALMLANFVWISLFIGVLCTRFRDLPPIIGNLLQILFFITPVMYRPDSLPSHLTFIVGLNPFYYLVEAMRAPMLGYAPPSHTYAVLMLGALVGLFAAFWFFVRTRARIAYWL